MLGTSPFRYNISNYISGIAYHLKLCIKMLPCVTAVGLRASNTQYTFITARVGLAVVRSGLSRHSVRYGDEYYFSTFVGWACTNLTGRWRALFARYF